MAVVKRVPSALRISPAAMMSKRCAKQRKVSEILAVTCIWFTILLFNGTQAQIYQTYRQVEGKNQSQLLNTTTLAQQDANTTTRRRSDDVQTSGIRISRAGRSVEYNSPIKRILELISQHHHGPPVQIVLSDNPTNNQQKQQYNPTVSGAAPAATSSDSQQQWTLVSNGNQQPQQLTDSPMLMAQPQHLMQSSMPHEQQQYFLTSNNLMGASQQQAQPFAMMPQPMMTFDPTQQQQQQPAQILSYMPTNTNPEQFVQQAQLQSIGDSVQPVFLSSYVPQVQQQAPIVAQPQQQPTQQQQPSSQPNSIQQIQKSQDQDAEKTPQDAPPETDGSLNDDEPSEPPAGGESGESSSGGESSFRSPQNDPDEPPDGPSSGSMSYEDKYDSDRDGPQTESSRNHAKTEATGDSPSSSPPVSTNGLVGVGLVDECMQCICRASSGCDSELRCITRGSEERYCGPFKLTEEYWRSAGSPRDSPTDFSAFEECANDVDCASETVTNYMKKHLKDCDDDEQITCMDYARLHRLRPDECGDTEKLADFRVFGDYWQNFLSCAEGINKTRTPESEFI